MRRRSRSETANLISRLQTARNAGRLVPVSHLAAQAGLNCRCEVTVNLWNSLFWQYPSAGERDYVDIVSVLRHVRERYESEFAKQPMQLFIRPPVVPWWMGPRFTLKVVLLYRYRELESLVVMPELGSLATLYSMFQPPLPATLLLNLQLACRGLHFVAQPAERGGLRCLKRTVAELTRTSPLYLEIEDFLEKLPTPTVPAEFTLEEYRNVVCRDLFERIGLTAAVAEMSGSDFKLGVANVLQLMASLLMMMPLQADATIANQVQLLH